MLPRRGWVGTKNNRRLATIASARTSLVVVRKRGAGLVRSARALLFVILSVVQTGFSGIDPSNNLGAPAYR